ncbi:hypothetical protein WME75_17995 [Sorangium sp. So ce1014]|uniref:hypothetical protein n=1 Tax=Sorangium sp. So ce1014 TaxID=3133326 RepID=UPI003F6212D9
MFSKIKNLYFAPLIFLVGTIVWCGSRPDAAVLVPEGEVYLYCPGYENDLPKFVDALMEGAVLPDKLTPCLPLDVNKSLKTNIVDGKTDRAIRQLDAFGWQMFIALNWPVEQDGGYLRFARSLGGPGAPRWYGWDTSEDVFNVKGDVPGGRHILSDRQADMHQLWDQRGQLVGFEVQMNQVARDTIRNNKLNTAEGQSAVLSRVLFPWGLANTDEKRLGSMVIKLAWKALGAQDHRERFFRRAAEMPGSPEQREFGLVGMHIGYKLSFIDSKWVWITFEHIDGVDDGGEPACPAPALPPLAEPLFYDKQCKPEACPKNDPESKNPHLGPNRKATQVVRRVPIQPETVDFNCKVRALLHAHAPQSPAQFYKLIAAQSAVRRGEKWQYVPSHSQNTLLETYQQDSEKEEERGCMQCHLRAPLKAKNESGVFIDDPGQGDFMYMLTQRLQIQQ